MIRQQWVHELAILASVATVVALLVALLALRQFARGVLRTRRRRSDRTPSSLGLDAEPFELASSRGAVRGWVVHAGPGAAPTVLFVHGWRSHAGDMLPWAAPLVRHGYHAIVYDALGHGDSDDSEFTSLRHLREDMDDVLGYARTLARTAPGIVLFGHSMGGAAAILAAAKEAPIRGLITAGAPTDPLQITAEWLDSRGLPGPLLVRLLRPFWQRIVREPYATLRPVRRIGRVTVPVLILHGSEDVQVGIHHARALAAANPLARLELLEGADHVNLPEHPRYEAVVLSFLARTIGRARATR